MSDERDGSDAAADAGEAEEGGRTAVVTRPQRPTGKRSRRRTDDDATPAEDAAGAAAETKTTKKTKKGKKTKKPAGPNPFMFVYNYLKQVVGELRKVIWPNRKQMITYTSVVLTFLVFMTALIAGSDYGFAKLVMLVFGE